MEIRDNIRSWFHDVLVPLSLRGLCAMRAPDGVFSNTSRLDGTGVLRAVGQSYRYSAMVLVGLAMQARFDNKPPMATTTIQEELVRWATTCEQIGDAGLVLWALALNDDSRVEDVLQSIERRWTASHQAQRGMASMPAGWLLAGLSVAYQLGTADRRALVLSEQVVHRLLTNRDNKTGLFSLGGTLPKRNVLRRLTNAHLGSFASQVYPTIGLAYYAMASGRLEPLQVALDTADRLCALQGPEGQWWWVYNVRTGQPVIKYPVYTVHQDAMGPMALLAVMLASRQKDYSAAILKSLDWLEQHPELPEQGLVDTAHGVVWRAIQRDRPNCTSGYGLGLGERLRMNLAAWTGWADTRAFTRGYVCDECRPYHLGWILAAAGMLAALEC